MHLWIEKAVGLNYQPNGAWMRGCKSFRGIFQENTSTEWSVWETVPLDTQNVLLYFSYQACHIASARTLFPRAWGRAVELSQMLLSSLSNWVATAVIVGGSLCLRAWPIVNENETPPFTEAFRLVLSGPKISSGVKEHVSWWPSNTVEGAIAWKKLDHW